MESGNGRDDSLKLKTASGSTTQGSSVSPSFSDLIDNQKTLTLRNETTSFEPGERSKPATGIWGHLTLLEQVGTGGFGEVYRAWDPTLQREVALKLLVAGAPASVELESEGRLLARVRHPNVVLVFGLAEHDGRVGLWEEFIRGRTLAQILEDRGQFSAAEAVSIGKALCHALVAVHGAGLIHRDIKAQNVMREEGGRIVLMDFGLGLETPSKDNPGAFRMTARGGTPVYMAPELVRGEAPTIRSDIYAVGVLMYHLVTRSYPVTGQSWPEFAKAHAEGQYRLLHDARADLPADFVQTVERAMAANPQDRFETAGHLLRALGMVEAASYVSEAGGPLLFQSPRLKQKRRTMLGAAVLLLGAASYGLYVKRMDSWFPNRGDDEKTAIAVLPFSNASSKPENDYLADGIAEEITNQLTKIEGIRIIARSSTAQYKGQALDLEKMREQLHVDMILTGGVRRVEHRIRVSAQLVRIPDGTQVWSEVFERELKDVFAVQDQISRAVADVLRLKLANGPDSLNRREDPEAYDLYLQGRFFTNRTSPANLEKAIGYYQQALKRDENYARAWAGLSSAYANLTLVDSPRKELVSKAISAAQRALALDSRLSEAHTSLGYVKQSHEWDWPGAESEFKKAISLNPRDAESRFYYAGLLMDMLRTKEAREQLSEAEKIDPLSPKVNLFLSLTLTIEGRREEAEQQIYKLLASAPESVNAYTLLGQLQMQLGRHKEGIESLRRGLQVSQSPYVKARLGWAYAVAGEEREAKRILHELIQAESKGEASPGQIASIYGGLGDIDTAYLWMEKAIRIHDPALVQILISANYDQLRKDRRFSSIVDRVGLGLSN